MSDVIDIKDFYNQETRISIVESAVLGIDKRLDSMIVENRSQFRWTMTLIVGLYALFSGTLISVIKFVH